MFNFFFNEVSINIVIGFFYSALIGITTLILTEKINRDKELNELLTNLTKLSLSIVPIRITIDNISNMEGEEYRRYFADILDNNTEGKKYDKEKIYGFILYDSIPKLSDLSEYMIQKLNETTDSILNSKDSEKELNELLNKSKNYKDNFVITSGAISITYYFLNAQVESLNNQLNYYRDLTLELIDTNISTCPENVARNKLIVFKECTNKIIKNAKEIKDGLEIFETAVTNYRKNISDKISNNKQSKKKIIKLLIIAMIMLTIYLFIA